MTYEPGQLLRYLHDKALPELDKILKTAPLSEWHSLDVDYTPPRVERIWIPFENHRINLHRIWPCDKALYHPHPWPSAIYVLTGKYEMAVGTKDVEASRVVLTAGSSYEMINPEGWHYVRPLDEPSLSVMLTGKPFENQVFDHGDFGKDAPLQPLSETAKMNLIYDTRQEVEKYMDLMRWRQLAQQAEAEAL